MTLTGLCLTNCSPKVSSIKLKNYESVVGVKIGMPITDAIAKADKKYFVEKTEIIVYEGQEKQFDYIVFENVDKTVTLFSFNAGLKKQDISNVFRIVIKSPKYITAEGISVGMSLKDLKEKAQIKSADFNYDDGLYIASAKFDGGYWMETDVDTYKAYDFNKPTLHNLPDDLKIKAVILF